ncbi:hypothetical protein AtDm6_0942 [Acetobacter tropicalis]|uniref:Uncharacterized protein n=1 Tax=Acetobacter tropicalis TaxID=104102 RepID=A0A094ZT24_9PROT|nr:hypothetical protein AtDm6_0942 [Acetobacter tropicalis]
MPDTAEPTQGHSVGRSIGAAAQSPMERILLARRVCQAVAMRHMCYHLLAPWAGRVCVRSPVLAAGMSVPARPA